MKAIQSAAALLLAILLGCASGGAGQGQAGKGQSSGSGPSDATPEARSPFPTEKELADLGDAAPAAELGTLDIRDVEEWELSGPFPDRIEAYPYVEPNRWGEMLSEVTGSRPGLVVPTHAMHCVAAELGRFYLEHGGRPADSLRRYIAGRCMASGSRISFGYLHEHVGEEASEERVYNQWALAASRLVAEQMAGGPRTLGLWFGRTGPEAVLMVASGLRDAHIEPVSTVVGEGGQLSIRGESLRPAESVWAVMGRGRYGYADCESDSSVALPRFAFTCELERGDSEAWISVGIREPDRLLASWGIDILARAPGEKATRYRRPSYTESSQVEDPEAAEASLVEMVNRVRRDAGLTPLEPSPEQSESARELAPHYFSAMLGGSSPSVADLVALGMLAGWRVDGIVQEGQFSSGFVAQSHDAARLLAEALSHPVSRRALLAPDADLIAVGPLLGDEEEGYLAAIFGTYVLFSADAHQEIARQVYEKLEADRLARGTRSPHHLVDVAMLTLEAASRVDGGEAPPDVFDELLQASMQILGRPVQGWVAEVQDLADLEFPPDFLDRPDLGVSIGVSYRQPDDEPWGRYVVMLVVAAPEGRSA